MSSENIARNLRILWRADKIIADIRLRHLLFNLGLEAFAALIAIFGLLMIELAAYFALVQTASAIVSAAVLGALNFLIAIAIFIIALKRPLGRELDLANEIHVSAIETLQAEAVALQSQLAGMFHRPMESALPSLILPLIMIAIKSLRKSQAPQQSMAE